MSWFPNRTDVRGASKGGNGPLHRTVSGEGDPQPRVWMHFPGWGAGPVKSTSESSPRRKGHSKVDVG